MSRRRTAVRVMLILCYDARRRLDLSHLISSHLVTSFGKVW